MTQNHNVGQGVRFAVNLNSSDVNVVWDEALAVNAALKTAYPSGSIGSACPVTELPGGTLRIEGTPVDRPWPPRVTKYEKYLGHGTSVGCWSVDDIGAGFGGIPDTKGKAIAKALKFWATEKRAFQVQLADNGRCIYIESRPAGGGGPWHYEGSLFWDVKSQKLKGLSHIADLVAAWNKDCYRWQERIAAAMSDDELPIAGGKHATIAFALKDHRAKVRMSPSPTPEPQMPEPVIQGTTAEKFMAAVRPVWVNLDADATNLLQDFVSFPGHAIESGAQYFPETAPEAREELRINQGRWQSIPLADVDDETRGHIRRLAFEAKQAEFIRTYLAPRAEALKFAFGGGSQLTQETIRDSLYGLIMNGGVLRNAAVRMSVPIYMALIFGDDPEERDWVKSWVAEVTEQLSLALLLE